MIETAITERAVQRALLGNQIAGSYAATSCSVSSSRAHAWRSSSLCEHFGTSRMPVRDGLRILLHEGLLMLDNPNHTVVAPLSRSDLLDAFSIEGALTGMAAERAARIATVEDIDALEALHQAMLDAARDQAQDDMAALNWTFHRHINHLSGSRKILVALRVVSLDLPRDYPVQLPEWNARSNADHAAIVTALRERDHVAARKAVEAHVIESGHGLIAYLESQGLELD